MKKIKILSVSIIILATCFYLNPLNRGMADFMKEDGSLQIFGEASGLFAAFLKFALVSLLIAAPSLLLGPLCEGKQFLKVGLFVGLLFSAICILQFLLLAKSQIVETAGFRMAMYFIFPYFFQGFLGGGIWGFIGTKLLKKNPEA